MVQGRREREKKGVREVEREVGAWEKCSVTKSLAIPARKSAHRLNSLGVYDHKMGGREKAMTCCASSRSCCRSGRRYFPCDVIKSITALLSPLISN